MMGTATQQGHIRTVPIQGATTFESDALDFKVLACLSATFLWTAGCVASISAVLGCQLATKLEPTNK